MLCFTGAATNLTESRLAIRDSRCPACAGARHSTKAFPHLHQLGAGNADPQTGYRVRADGHDTLIGETSAVAPLWAGLFARINQRLGDLKLPTAGFINPILYQNPGHFRDIPEGNNDTDGTLRKYNAGPGWDACTGLGSPNGTKILKTLEGR